MATIAITVSLKQQTTLMLNKIIPNALKLVIKYVNTINNEFNYSARCLSTLEKPLMTTDEREENNKRLKPTLKLEYSLSKLLTHLQITFENAHEIYCKFDNKINIEDLVEQVFALQEQLTLCEQTLDQFCGIYGILVKKSVIKQSEKVRETIDEKIKSVVKKEQVIDTVDKDIEVRDEEYEMYVGNSSDDDDDQVNEKRNDFCEENQSSACLLLVLQELKDRLRERQIMRAKKLGLPLPENEVS